MFIPICYFVYVVLLQSHPHVFQISDKKSKSKVPWQNVSLSQSITSKLKEICQWWRDALLVFRPSCFVGFYVNFSEYFSDITIYWHF